MATHTLVLLLAVKDTKDGEEQVDNVEIQADGGSNLLLDVVRAHDELGVDEDVAAEDKGGQAAVDELGGGAVGQEHGDEAEEDQAPEGAKQVRHPRGEVVLGLEGERGQEDEHASRQEDGVEHDR